MPHKTPKDVSNMKKDACCCEIEAEIVINVSKLGVGAAGYGQSAGVWSVGVSDVRTQGSKTRLKLVCFALATGTSMSLYFGGSE